MTQTFEQGMLQKIIRHHQDIKTMTVDTFHGWACSGNGAPLEWRELPLKTFDDDTVELNITHCGICGSDIHTMDAGWGPTDFPCVVGHEIAGIVTRVGKNVKHIKVGDRAGIGAQSGSCMECTRCKSRKEHLCAGMIGTYNSRWPNGDKTYGGYADKWRGHQRFVFKVPDGMTNEVAATFFCGGITAYSPLKRHGVKKGDKVGIIGIGGIGHFGIQWAKAMGAEVVALSSSDRKRVDAMKLGCDDYVVLGDQDAMKKHADSFTHILCTSFSTDFDWDGYFSMMKPNAYFILVGVPEERLKGIHALKLALREIAIVGSCIGSPDMIEEMLQFAVDHEIVPWLKKFPMKEAPLAVQAMRDGKARFRFVLEN